MTNIDHCDDVLAGVYDLPIVYEGKPPIVIDIGANVGAFAIWASQKWPGCCLFCYEPIPDNYDTLMDNTAHLQHCLRRNVGVRMCGGQMEIAEGAFNCGEWSCQPGINKETGKRMVVPCIPAADIPRGNILKIDTEGCELEILKALWDAGRSAEFSVILLEWHRESDRLEIDQLLKDNYQLCGAVCNQPERGVAKYVWRKAVKKI